MYLRGPIILCAPLALTACGTLEEGLPSAEGVACNTTDECSAAEVCWRGSCVATGETFDETYDANRLDATEATCTQPGSVRLATRGVTTLPLPSGCTRVLIKAWGAGGGRAATGPAEGGAGGFAATILTGVLGPLTVTVGGSGGDAVAGRGGDGGFNGGARGGDHAYSGAGGGGGASSVALAGELLLVAGGGGGAGTATCADGGAAGQDGAPDCGLALPGRAGTSTGGGAGGMSYQCATGGEAGQHLIGGAGSVRDITSSSHYPGGGGGGGYYGGGGGGCARATAGGAAGGGGSSHAPGGTTLDGTFTLPGNDGDPDRGTGGEPGHDGVVIVSWS